jgi:hypothetical protein
MKVVQLLEFIRCDPAQFAQQELFNGASLFF